MSSRGLLAMMEHPLAALVSLIAIVAAIASTVTWVGTTFVFKSDYNKDKNWHEYTHQNLRVERLKDEADRLNTKQLVQAGKLSIQDAAELKLWQDKLKEAQVKLDTAEDYAKGRKQRGD